MNLTIKRKIRGRMEEKGGTLGFVVQLPSVSKKEVKEAAHDYVRCALENDGALNEEVVKQALWEAYTTGFEDAARLVYDDFCITDVLDDAS